MRHAIYTNEGAEDLGGDLRDLFAGYELPLLGFATCLMEHALRNQVIWLESQKEDIKTLVSSIKVQLLAHMFVSRTVKSEWRVSTAGSMVRIAYSLLSVALSDVLRSRDERRR